MLDSKKYGPWAVIPGGSEGLGESFANKIGQAGINVVLIARKEEPLENVARKIRAESGVQVRTLSLDLTRPDMLERIRALTDDIDVGLVVYNAGASHKMARFLDGSLEDALKLIYLNAVGQTSLCHHFGKKMASRGHGGIILVGSLAGGAGSPGVTAYGAAKAYTAVLGEGLWAEMKPYGIDVLHVVVGAVETPAMARLGLKHSADEEISVTHPDALAQQTLDNIANGPVYLPPDLADYFQRLHALPRKQATEMMADTLRPFWS